MIDLSCLCGAVHVRVAQRPEFIHACNCTLCSKTGAHWAYYHPDAVTVAGSTRGITRSDKDDPAAETHFCERCGSTSHFVLTASAVAKVGNTMMGVNMALADPRDLVGVELRFPDGRGWDGAGAFGYVEPARIIGQGTTPAA